MPGRMSGTTLRFGVVCVAAFCIVTMGIGLSRIGSHDKSRTRHSRPAYKQVHLAPDPLAYGPTPNPAVASDSDEDGSDTEVAVTPAPSAQEQLLQQEGSEGADRASHDYLFSSRERAAAGHVAKGRHAKPPKHRRTAAPSQYDEDADERDLQSLREQLRRSQERVVKEKERQKLVDRIARLEKEISDARKWDREVAEEARREHERMRERWEDRAIDQKRWRIQVERKRAHDLEEFDQSMHRRSAASQEQDALAAGGGGAAQGAAAQQCPGMGVPHVPHYSEYKKTIEVPEFAYATFVTSSDFVIPAAVLLHSIAVSGSQYGRVVAVTEAVSDNDVRILANFAEVVRIKGVPSPKKIDTDRYKETFTKLRIWQLTRWKKLFYIDTDVLVLRNMDDVFDLHEWAVPMDARFNRYSTGMMLVEPRLSTFQDMIYELKTTEVSMELPDLLFLKEFFDKRKDVKITHLPRWYQVYQEEFGASKKTYLVEDKGVVRIFDQRIHGIHYPGATKPFTDIAKLQAKWGHILCNWAGREEIAYEPHFLWLWGYELMRRDLKEYAQAMYFTHERGAIITDIEEAPEKPPPTPAPPGSPPTTPAPPASSPQSPAVPGATPAPSAMPSPVFKPMECKVDTADGAIDLQRLEPVRFTMSHESFNFDGVDVTEHSAQIVPHEWVLTWCTPFKLPPPGSQECSANSFASEYVGGFCKTSYDVNMTLTELPDTRGLVLRAESRKTTIVKVLEAHLVCSMDPGYHEVWANSTVVPVVDTQNTSRSDRLYSMTLLSPCFCPGVCLSNDTSVAHLELDEQRTRADGKCGETNRLPNGDIGECNPMSDSPCCSSLGYCGASEQHCKCPNCLDYRKVYKEALFRHAEEVRLTSAIYAIGEHAESETSGSAQEGEGVASSEASGSASGSQGSSGSAEEQSGSGGGKKGASEEGDGEAQQHDAGGASAEGHASASGGGGGAKHGGSEEKAVEAVAFRSRSILQKAEKGSKGGEGSEEGHKGAAGSGGGGEEEEKKTKKKKAVPLPTPRTRSGVADDVADGHVSDKAKGKKSSGGKGIGGGADLVLDAHAQSHEGSEHGGVHEGGHGEEEGSGHHGHEHGRGSDSGSESGVHGSGHVVAGSGSGVGVKDGGDKEGHKQGLSDRRGMPAPLKSKEGAAGSEEGEERVRQGEDIAQQQAEELAAALRDRGNKKWNREEGKSDDEESGEGTPQKTKAPQKKTSKSKSKSKAKSKSKSRTDKTDADGDAKASKSKQKSKKAPHKKAGKKGKAKGKHKSSETVRETESEEGSGSGAGKAPQLRYEAMRNGTCLPGAYFVLESLEECEAAAQDVLEKKHAQDKKADPKLKDKTSPAKPVVYATSPCNIQNPKGCYQHLRTGVFYWNPCGNAFSQAPFRVAVCKAPFDPLAKCLLEREWLHPWEVSALNEAERRQAVAAEVDRFRFRAGLPVLDVWHADDDELLEECKHAGNATFAASAKREGPPHVPVPEKPKKPSVLPQPDAKRRQMYIKRRAKRKAWEIIDNKEQAEAADHAYDMLYEDYEAHKRYTEEGSVDDSAAGMFEESSSSDGAKEESLEDLEEELERLASNDQYDLARKLQRIIRQRKAQMIAALQEQKAKAVANEDFDEAAVIKEQILTLNHSLARAATTAEWQALRVNFTVGATVRLILPVIFKNGTRLRVGDTGIIEAVPGRTKNSTATARVNGILFDLRPAQAEVIKLPVAVKKKRKITPLPTPVPTPAGKQKKGKKGKKAKKTPEPPEVDFLGIKAEATPLTPPVVPPKRLRRKARTVTPAPQQGTQQQNTSCPGANLVACLESCDESALKSCMRRCMLLCSPSSRQQNETKPVNQPTATCESPSKSATLVPSTVLVNDTKFATVIPSGTDVDVSSVMHAELLRSLMHNDLRSVSAPQVVDIGAGSGVFSLYAHHMNATVQVFEPRKLYYKALKCSRGSWTFPIKRVVFTKRASRCVLEVPVTKKGLNVTDLTPSFKTDCTGDDAVVTGVKGDEVLTSRVHVLRVATRGSEDDVLAGLTGLFRDVGVDHALVTVSPSSLKGVKAFFSKLRGQVSVMWPPMHAKGVVRMSVASLRPKDVTEFSFPTLFFSRIPRAKQAWSGPQAPAGKP